MLYDEEGNPHVEPPLLPEEYHTLCIVKDYMRMFDENQKLRAKNNKLRISLKKLNSHQYSLRRLCQSHVEMIRHCIKYMKKKGVKPDAFIEDYMKAKLL